MPNQTIRTLLLSRTAVWIAVLTISLAAVAVIFGLASDVAVAAFAGAFASVMIGRLWSFLDRLEKRSRLHHNALVKIEIYLNRVMDIGENNRVMLKKSREIMGKRTGLPPIPSDLLRIKELPLLSDESLLDLAHSPLLNALFGFCQAIDKLNEDIRLVISEYQDFLAGLRDPKKIIEVMKIEDKDRMKLVIQRFEQLEKKHENVVRDAIERTAEVRAHQKVIPLDYKLLRKLTEVRLPDNFEERVAGAKRTLLAEIHKNSEGQFRIEDLDH